MPFAISVIIACIIAAAAVATAGVVTAGDVAETKVETENESDFLQWLSINNPDLFLELTDQPDPVNYTLPIIAGLSLIGIVLLVKR